MSMYNSALMLQQSAIASYLSSGELPVRSGSAAPYAAPNEAYPTKDGWIMVAAYHEDRWKAFCRVIGDPALATRPEFSTNPQRVANRASLAREVSLRLAAKTSAEWQGLLEQADVICGPIAEYDEVLASPQLAHNGAIVHRTSRHRAHARRGIRDRDASRVHYPPPIGEHSRCTRHVRLRCVGDRCVAGLRL